MNSAVLFRTGKGVRRVEFLEWLKRLFKLRFKIRLAAEIELESGKEE